MMRSKSIVINYIHYIELGLSEKVNADTVNRKSDLNNSSSEQQDALIDERKVIPIRQERFSISKETVTEDIKIEKRSITKTKKVEVPIIDEEIYINGRRLRYYNKLNGSQMLSKVRDKLKEHLDIASNDKKEQGYSLLEAHESKREIVPLFEGVNDGTDISNNKGTEKVIPIFGEEIVISKRRAKVGELVIKKNRVTINNKIKIDIKKEEATVENPDITKPGTD